jgi:magnesium transporter
MTDYPETPDRDDEEPYMLDRATVAAILEAVEARDATRMAALFAPLHAADIADLLEQVDAEDRAGIIRLLGAEFDGEILTELDEAIREEVIAVLSPEVLAEAVRDLDSDDVVDLIEDLETEQKDAILGALEDDDRAVVQSSLAYPEGSAGRLMQREIVWAPEHWTVGEAIDWLRAAPTSPSAASCPRAATRPWPPLPRRSSGSSRPRRTKKTSPMPSTSTT